MTNLIQHLAWDSDFFGRRVGKLSVSSTDALDHLLQLAKLQKYRLLYIFSPITLNESCNCPFFIFDVGGHIHFSLNLLDHHLQALQTSESIHEFSSNFHTPDLLQLAFLSGHLSRFKTDPLLPTSSFEQLYETWLHKTLISRPGSTIYTYQISGRNVGLISAEWTGSKCVIGLLAVLPSFQGQGIGRRLLDHVKQACVSNSFSQIEVRTQLSNAAARTLYLRSGFAEHDRSFLYHAHRR